MEGYSEIVYKNKTILYVDYSSFNSDKEKVLQLLEAATEEWVKQPPHSVLALLNVTNMRFDLDVVNAFKESASKTASYEKKLAIIGVKGLLKIAYNFVTGKGTTTDSRKLFDSELEAKEWLVEDLLI